MPNDTNQTDNEYVQMIPIVNSFVLFIVGVIVESADQFRPVSGESLLKRVIHAIR